MFFKKNAFIAVFLLSVLCGLNVKAQKDSTSVLKGISIRPRLHYGFIVCHHPEMAYFTDRHVAPFELMISKKTNGTKAWHKFYNYPETGFSFFITSFSSSPILGKALAAYPYISVPLVGNTDKTSLNLIIGSGVSYFTKRFNIYENYKNLAVSSRFNAVISVKADYRFRLSEAFDMSFAAGLTHFSNGAVKTPNLGLNVFTLSSAVSLYPYGRVVPVNATLEDDAGRFSFSTWVSGAVKETYPVCGQKYYVANLGFETFRTLGHISSIGSGIDFFYDETDIKYMKDFDIHYNSDIEAMKIGFNIAHRLKLSKLSFNQYIGYYLYAKNKSVGSFYQRLALRYRFYKGLFVNLSLKTHWGKADFTEWGIGYSF